MTISLPYLMEDPKKPYKPKEKCPQKAKGMSFAFLFSIFVYISAFYIFNLSPSTLFKTSKFWFLISNTLILILAVDYGAFSSSKNKQQDVYDEYLTHSEARRAISAPSTSFASECQEIATKGHILHEQPLLQQQDYAQKYMQGDLDKNSYTKTPERKLLQIEAKEDKKEDHVQEKRIVHVDHKRGFDTNKAIDVQTKTYRRSKSEKAKRVVFDETKNNVILKRSETNYKEQEQEHDHDHHDVEAMNEFATMSDEDLNRRVEEFIQRFNRQIRLQARADI